MKENKHNRYMFRLAGLFSLAFHISSIALCITCLLNRSLLDVNMIALYVSVGFANFGIPFSIYILLMGRQAVKEFKSHYLIVNIMMMINIISIIPYLIGLQFSIVSLLIIVCVVITNIPFIFEIKLNEKYINGIELARKAQLEQIYKIKENEKQIDEDLKTEENMAAFGKVAAPLSREQKIIQQLKEINVLYDSGLMEEKEYIELKEKIKAM